MQTQITPRCVIEEETEELGKKPLRRPPSNKLIYQRIKLEYINNKRPSNPNLPHVLEPSKLLLPTDFSESCLLQHFGSRDMLDCICQASSASFGKSLKLSKLQKTLYTLNRWGCIQVQISSQGMIMGERRRRCYNNFLLRMSSSLSKR